MTRNNFYLPKVELIWSLFVQKTINFLWNLHTAQTILWFGTAKAAIAWAAFMCNCPFLFFRTEYVLFSFLWFKWDHFIFKFCLMWNKHCIRWFDRSDTFTLHILKTTRPKDGGRRVLDTFFFTLFRVCFSSEYLIMLLSSSKKQHSQLNLKILPHRVQRSMNKLRTNKSWNVS